MRGGVADALGDENFGYGGGHIRSGVSYIQRRDATFLVADFVFALMFRADLTFNLGPFIWFLKKGQRVGRRGLWWVELA